MNKNLTTASSAKLDLMLDQLATQTLQTGRLVFALDATMSRQPTWDRACELQADMFAEAAGVGGLEIQLVYYRGSKFGFSEWMTDGRRLGAAMRRIKTEAGFTQIGRVLQHAKREHDKLPIAALVFVGDAMEEEVDVLCGHARELNKRGIKCFMFQEGDDEEVEQAYREIARLTGGAYCKFSEGSAQELKDLLRAVAAYVAGGMKALSNKAQGAAVKLLEQLNK